jgi:hypothetical protein
MFCTKQIGSSGNVSDLYLGGGLNLGQDTIVRLFEVFFLQANADINSNYTKTVSFHILSKNIQYS